MLDSLVFFSPNSAAHWEAPFWDYATARWEAEDIHLSSLGQKGFDKLARIAAEHFVAERAERS